MSHAGGVTDLDLTLSYTQGLVQEASAVELLSNKCLKTSKYQVRVTWLNIGGDGTRCSWLQIQARQGESGYYIQWEWGQIFWLVAKILCSVEVTAAWSCLVRGLCVLSVI